MKTTLSVIIFGLLFSQHCFAGQEQTITVAGRVVDYQARPVEGATVICYKTIINWEIGQRNSELLERVKTSSDGSFSFEVKKENNSPFIVAYKPGLALGWAGINIESELSPTIRLGEPTLFKGIVVDETGQPVSGARVIMCLKKEMARAHNEFFLPEPEDWFTTRADTQGQFVFNNVPAGVTADFGVEAPGMASIWTFSDHIHLLEGEQFFAGRDDIRIVLPHEARIEGRVVDELTGQGAADVHILARPYKRSGETYLPKPVKTDKDGRFEFTQLETNKYLLRIIADTKGYGNITVTAESGQTIEDVNIIYKKGVTFEAAVYNSVNNKPIENADVTITQSDTESGYTTFSQKLTTDANGLARLYVPPGESNLEVVKLDYGGTFTDVHRYKINPREGQREDVFVPKTAFFLSGEVMDDQGNALPGASVLTIEFGPHVLTYANGRFDTSNLHYFNINLPLKMQVMARYTPSSLAAFAVLEDPNKTGNIRGQIILKPAYTLAGRVVDSTGKSIPAAYIKLLACKKGSTLTTFVTEVTTEKSGVYYIRSVPLPADNVKYFIIAHAEGYGQNVVTQIPFTDDITKPANIDPIILLPADKEISGVVLDADDEPIAGVLVTIEGPELIRNYYRPPYRKVITDLQGRFCANGVCEEPLEIYVRSSSEQQESGQTFARGGDKDVKVVLGQILYHMPSLIGKELPNLKGFGIKPPDIDKKILFCFFDVQQRPSRNCMMQLARQAEELKEKSVTIIAVQTSKVERAKLEEWIKEKNISFPVGTIEANEERTRFTWGVKSLPWLILTDNQHIVRSQGFGIDELNKRIQE